MVLNRCEFDQLVNQTKPKILRAFEHHRFKPQKVFIESTELAKQKSILTTINKLNRITNRKMKFEIGLKNVWSGFHWIILVILLAAHQMALEQKAQMLIFVLLLTMKGLVRTIS